ALELLEQLNAAHRRHAPVEQDDVDCRIAIEVIESRQAVGKIADSKSPVAELVLQRLPVQGVIVDKKNAWRGFVKKTINSRILQTVGEQCTVLGLRQIRHDSLPHTPRF